MGSMHHARNMHALQWHLFFYSTTALSVFTHDNSVYAAVFPAAHTTWISSTFA